ncbi:MAG: MFS transporter [Pseudomonadota bacterium]
MKSEERKKFISIMIWFCITMFYCYQYILRALPNIIMPDIMGKYSVGATEFSSFAGMYYVGYVIVHIPIGILLSRFGARAVLPMCIAITSIGLVPLVYFDNWTLVVIGRTLTGIGSSAAIVGALQIFRIIYPDKFSRMLGIMVFFGLITVVYAGSPLANVIAIIGIDATIGVLLYSGIALAVFTYLLMPKSAGETSHASILTDIKATLGNPKIIVASLLAGFMVGPLEGFADAWGSAFMITVYGIEKSVADTITLSVFLGMCIGCIVLPYIADKTRMYFGVTIVSGIVMILCFVHILNGDANADSLYYACLVTGVFCAYQVVIISKIATFVSEERSGVAAAIANMIIMAFGLLFHKFIGITLDWQWDGTWKGQMIQGVRSYGTDAFVNSISIIPAATTIAVVGFIIMAMTNVIRVKLMKK